MSYVTGEELARGKTKVVYATNQQGVVVLENLANITANDDPSVTRQFADKAIATTTTTCRIFELLRAAGVPVAYIEQVSPTSFAAKRCTMVPVEAIARRYAVGSYLERHPEIPKTQPFHRFGRLVTEFFLKTTQGHCTLGDREDHDLKLDPSRGEEDPLLVRTKDCWLLCHPKKPVWEKDADLRLLGFEHLPYDFEAMDTILREVFLVLEGAWATLGWRVIDLKIEFGLTPEGHLVVADVVDNDSWRLRNPYWEEMSKQVFRDQIARDAVDLDDINWRYQLVADLVGRLYIPRQAIVLWVESYDEAIKSYFDSMNIKIPAGVDLVRLLMSGYRRTQSILQAISTIEAEYPDGGVVIAYVGLSDGLGPIVSTHTHWPVINVPLRLEDAMGSLRLQDGVPTATILKLKNALHHALQVLAQKNPAAYAAVRELAETDAGLPAGVTLNDIGTKM